MQQRNTRPSTPQAAVPFLRALCASALLCAAAVPASGETKRLDPDMAAKEDCTVPVPELDSKPEWSASKETMAVLIASGKFEIRGSYRLQMCGFGLSVYVLQNSEDLSQVYECVSDDRYRPAFPCQKLTGPQAEKKS